MAWIAWRGWWVLIMAILKIIKIKSKTGDILLSSNEIPEAGKFK